MSKKKVAVTNVDLAEKIDALTGTVEQSIENLAGMTQRGFTEAGERFDRVEGRFDRVEIRLEGVESGLKRSKPKCLILVLSSLNWSVATSFSN